MVELLMPLAVFGSFVLVVGLVTRLFSNMSLNRTLREALRAHPASVPLLAQRLDSRQPWADALIGWIFIAFAAGLVLMSFFEPADERREVWQAAIVPLVVGVVVLAYVQWAKRERDQDADSSGAHAVDGATEAPPAPPPPPPAPAGATRKTKRT